RRYELAVEAGKTGVWEYIPSERKTIVDKGFLKLFGLKESNKKFESNEWISFVPIEDLQVINSKLNALIEGKSDSYSFEHRIKCIDESIKWVILKGKITKDVQPIKIVRTLTEITDLKETEKKLKKFADDLKQSNAAKDNFFSIVAHDLRNPFHTILGASELLANYSSDMTLEEIQETAKNIYRSASNVYNLLVNLPEWSRFQSGNLKVSKTQFNLCEIVNQVIELYAAQSERKKLVIYSQCDYACNVFTDKYMIESVVRNLISNAIKFTLSGKSIEIVFKNLNDDFAEFSVKDYGVGITASIKSKNQNFFRLIHKFL
ncbi:MAG: PAS domain-containing sensor histidine kinase, partial [Ignavibacterium sp.]|uniref:PAS domain-containing sensor histidine kinase n=1 Tax=Ignavibacterium sp. TaxID=2651167 RepID=UPI004049BF73